VLQEHPANEQKVYRNLIEGVHSRIVNAVGWIKVQFERLLSGKILLRKLMQAVVALSHRRECSLDLPIQLIH
jgi:hypothetical protein